MTTDAQQARWPTFLVIGAARSGTTALHGFLRQHPQAWVPQFKEPNYFALRAMDIDLGSLPPEARARWGHAVSDPETYQRLFAVPVPDSSAAGQPETSSTPMPPDGPAVPPPVQVPPAPTAWGECSPVYMVVEGVADLIRSTIPEVRLVAVLRDPVTRAVSHHAHNLAHTLEERTDLREAIEADRARGVHSEYTRPGWYAEHLSPYLAAFPREQILLLDHADLERDRDAFLARVFAHVGVDPDFRVTDQPRALATQPRIVDESLLAELADIYRDDTRRLIEELGFDEARRWSTA